MGKGNGRMVGGRYHCIMVRSVDFILGATAALLIVFYRILVVTIIF